MIVDHVYDLVTDDPFLRLYGFLEDKTLILKIEGLNPAGSVKLKTCARHNLETGAHALFSTPPTTAPAL